MSDETKYFVAWVSLCVAYVAGDYVIRLLKFVSWRDWFRANVQYMPSREKLLAEEGIIE